MRKSFVACSALGIAFMTSAAGAETLRVPSDDYPTIQSAVSAAGPNDKVIVGRGTYDETVLVDSKSGLTIVGKGRPTLAPSGAGNGLTISACDTVTVRGIDVDGTNGHGVLVDGSNDVWVTRCRVSNPTLDGIRADDSVRLRIDRNFVSGPGSSGISLSGGSPTVTTDDSRVERNRISDCGDYGVLVNGSRNQVSRNRTTVTGDEGFLVEGIAPTGNVLERNTAIEATDDGFELNGVDNRLIRNRAIRSMCDGFDLETDATMCLAERNLAIDCAWGIDVEGDGNVLRLNRIVRTAQDAFSVSGDGNQFIRNRVDLAGDDGFNVEGDGNTFERNIVLRSVDDGFELSGTGNTFVKNRATKSGELDLADNAPGQNTIDENNRFGTVGSGSED